MQLNEENVNCAPATIKKIPDLKFLSLFNLAGTQQEYEFYKLPYTFINNLTNFQFNENGLNDMFVMKVEFQVELFAVHTSYLYKYSKNQLFNFEFTKDWFDLYNEVVRNHDFSGHVVTHSNYRFTTCSIPVSVYWYYFLYSYLRKGILFDEIMDLVPYPDILGDHMRLLLSGDIESNPGPIQSHPIQPRNNDPRVVKLENALKRRDDKIKTLIKHLRYEIKQYNNRTSCQMMSGIKNALHSTPLKLDDMNINLNRMCNFLENSLPGLQANIQATILQTTTSVQGMCEDITKVVVVSLIVSLMMRMEKYKLALAIILIFVVKFYGFDQSIINLVTELKSKFIVAQMNTEDIVYHPWFSVCGKILFSVLAFVAIRKIPGKKDWDSFIIRLDRIPKAVSGSKKIYDYCSEYFNVALDEVKMLVLGKSGEELKRFENQHMEIKAWAEEVRQYIELDQRNKIDTDITVANKVEELYIKGLAYQADKLLEHDKEISRLIAVTLVPARELYQYVTRSPVKGGGPKMKPVCLWLVGESGIGKTEMVYPLCIDVLRKMGLVGKDDFKHHVYGRQVETEFWDGYKNQKIVIYDDAFQMKDDKTTANPEIFEVIRSCNTFPQHLHMAALSDKNTFSAAELMIYTTNDFNVDIQSLTYTDAFFNRMTGNAYRVQPKLDKSIILEKGSTGEKYRILDKSKLSKEEAIDLSIYEFQKMIRDENSESKWIDVGEPIDYYELSDVICTSWKESKESALNKIKWLENFAARPITQMMPDFFEDCENLDFDDKYFVDDIAKRILEGQDMIIIESDYADNINKYNKYLDFKQSQRLPSKWDKYILRIDNCLLSLQDYFISMKKKIIEILQQHPYLTIFGAIGILLSGFAMYKWFENTLEAQAEVGTSGDSKTSKAKHVKVEVGASGDNKTIKMKLPKVEVGVSGDNKTNKTTHISVEGVDEHFESQGFSDTAAHHLVTDTLRKGTYRLSYKRGEKRYSLGNCTFVSGWVFVMPYHFLHALFARKLAPNTIIYFSQGGEKGDFADLIQVPLCHFIEVGVDSFELTTNCVRIEFKNGEARDCVVVNLHNKMCHPHANLIKHFVKINDQGRLNGKFKGSMATYHENNGMLFRSYQWLTSIRSLDKQIKIYYPDDGYDYLTDSYTQRDCYEYNAPTQVGDCGSLIGLYNHNIERKLIGMHIAGTGEEFGYACPLNQEVLLDAFKKLEIKDIKNISTQFYFEAPDNVNVLAEPKLPEGLFCPIGIADKRIGQAVKTSILPSRIYGKLSVPYTRPALLRPTLINGKIHNPLLNGLKKCGVETAVLPEEFVASAARDVFQVISTCYNTNLDKSKYQRILTYEEAIMGVYDDNFMCAINRTTSPGYPYSLENKGYPGKTRWMGNSEIFDFTSIDALSLRKDVVQLLDDCKNGKISNVIFVDTLKDERRDNAKVDVGKTRVFSAGPQHFVVAFRQYFLPFAAWLMHNRIDNEIGVGTNPYSYDWERIAKKLSKKGTRVIAGDFGNFDGSLVAQVLWEIFWGVYVPWLQQFIDFETEEGLDTLKICIGLWTHLVHSVHIYDNNVYMWTHSQPSGNPFTVIINCLYNMIIMRIAWIKIMEQDKRMFMSMKYFRKYVSMIAYGDDNVLNISEDVLDLFNQQTISDIMKEMKHEYTDEAKSGYIVKSRTLEEINFLKRGFRKSSELQRTVAPLKIEVIYEMLNWTRNTIDPDVILMTNIDTAFREIVLHGRIEYNKLYKGIMKLVDDLPEVPQILTYEQYLMDVETLSDELYQF